MAGRRFAKCSRTVTECNRRGRSGQPEDEEHVAAARLPEPTNEEHVAMLRRNHEGNLGHIRQLQYSQPGRVFSDEFLYSDRPRIRRLASKWVELGLN